MSEVAIGFILYKPTVAALARLEGLAANGYCLYVFDNEKCSIKLSLILKKFNNIKYCSLGFNAGISVGMRWIGISSIRDGFKHFLYFDQDTIFTDKTLIYIKNFACDECFFHKKLKRNFLSITFRDDVSRPSVNGYSVGDSFVNVVDFTISSGTLFNLSDLELIGWHDQNFFIDGVDYAICLSARNHGFLIGEISFTLGLDHKSEQADEYYYLAGLVFHARRYPFYRIKDTIFSYFSLLSKAFLYGDKSFFTLLKYSMSFIVGQIASRVAKK